MMIPDIAIQSIDIDNRRVKKSIRIRAESRNRTRLLKRHEDCTNYCSGLSFLGIDEMLKVRRDASGVRLTGEKYFH